MPNTKPVPPAGSNADAVGVDQQRDAPGGIERGRGPSDRMRLPHERDESPHQAADPARAPAGSTEKVEQAARDIERGLVDTERRGTPNDVPAPERRVRKQRGRT
jgi:hypothetical protein